MTERPTPYYEDDLVTLYHGDCLEVLRDLPGDSVDAVCTDPPYGLEFMGKGWDAPWRESDVNADAGFRGGGVSATKNAPSFTGSTNPKCMRCKGTRRGRRDGTAKVAVCLCADGGRFPNVRAVEMRAFGEWCEEWARECLRVLRPGGHMLAFGGSRTWHRLAAAVEDAGFEIRDSIAWIYGSGFPKSLDVSKAIDKLDASAERRERNLAFTAWLRSTGVTSRQLDGATDSFMGSHYLTDREQAAVPTAEMFDRVRPLLAVEVPEWVEALIVDREVESQNFKAREVIGTRTTGLGTGQGSVAYIGDSDNRDVTAPHTDAARTWQGWGTALKPAFEPIVVARKPLAGTVAANVLTHGTGALNVDGCRIGTDEVVQASASKGDPFGPGAYTLGEGRRASVAAGRWPANVILDESQAEALDAQSGELASGANPTRRGSDKFRDAYGDFKGQEECTPARGADVGGASRFFYVAKADSAERVKVDGIAHPTVKPLDLMRWLVRLVTPPGGTVLEPFAGSGTTTEACLLEGFRCIAIEREADYLPLIRQRIDRRLNPVAAIRSQGEEGGLFDLLSEETA